MSIGIDIGSAQIRVNLALTASVGTTSTGAYHTQLLAEVWNRLREMLQNLDWRETNTVAVAATCLTVVLEVVQVQSQECLRPFNCAADPRKYHESNHHDVWMWYDTRALRQAAELSRILKEDAAPWGGHILAELGLAKLKWLSDNYPDRRLVAFEYYDWISYLLLLGGFKDIDGVLVIPYIPVRNEFERGSIAVDGSVKGWPSQFLKEVGIGVNIEIGGCINEASRLFPVGVCLGNMNEKLRREIAPGAEVFIANGCIDAYAGWLSTYNANKSYISMVAGTSTCCFYVGTSPQTIPGVWGPVTLVTNSHYRQLFEFGQPSTGQLYERLIAGLSQVVENDQTGDFSRYDDPFEYMEHKTEELEQLYECTISQIIRPYMYHGDYHGNRSPYSLTTMGEMVIDGANSRPGLANVSDESLEAYVIRYNLIMEFLSFQIKQVLSIIRDNCSDYRVDGIVVAGSQNKNERFMRLLATVTGLPTYRLQEGEFNTLVGAALIAKICTKVGKREHSDDSYEEAFLSVLGKSRQYEEFNPDESASLDQKYAFWVRFSDLQRDFKLQMT